MIPQEVNTYAAVAITVFIFVIAWALFCAGSWRKP